MEATAGLMMIEVSLVASAMGIVLNHKGDTHTSRYMYMHSIWVGNLNCL